MYLLFQILLILHIKNEKRRVLRLEYGSRRMQWSTRPDNKLDGPITTFRWDIPTDVDFKNLSVREIVPASIRLKIDKY